MNGYTSRFKSTRQSERLLSDKLQVLLIERFGEAIETGKPIPRSEVYRALACAFSLKKAESKKIVLDLGFRNVRGGLVYNPG